jgi:hypothetical protein
LGGSEERNKPLNISSLSSVNTGNKIIEELNMKSEILNALIHGFEVEVNDQ